jgi:hypothetical protein
MVMEIGFVKKSLLSAGGEMGDAPLQAVQSTDVIPFPRQPNSGQQKT